MKRQMLTFAMVVTTAAGALTGCAQAAEVTPVNPPSEGLSLSPASNQIYECIVARGWDVELTWDGGVEASSDTIPLEQRDLFLKDSDECAAEIEAVVSAMGTEQIAAVYERELATRECLIESGFDVGAPPSQQQYIDTFNGERWSAYGASDVLNAAADEVEWRKINETCPQPAWSLGVE